MTNDELRALRETDWRAFVAAVTPERVIELLDENKRLRAYARHLTWCEWWVAEPACDCGFDAALEGAAPEETP